MRKLQKEYDELTVQRGKINEEIKALEESEIVKKYLQLIRQNNVLSYQQRNL